MNRFLFSKTFFFTLAYLPVLYLSIISCMALMLNLGGGCSGNSRVFEIKDSDQPEVESWTILALEITDGLLFKV